MGVAAIAAVSGQVSAALSGAVLQVRLDHPGKLNALSEVMWRELAAVFAAAADQPQLRAVLVRGAGGQFAAGADIAEFPRIRHDEPSGRAYHLETIAPALAAIAACPVPVIAAIEGVCVGGGLEIALACDLRIAAPDARLGAPVGKLGFPLALNEMVGLLEVAGPALAAELLLEGRLLGAAEAAARGLVNRVAADLDAEIEATLARVLAGSPLAARENKARLRLLRAQGGRCSVEQLAASFAYLESDDCREGVAAFIAGRAPQFTGY